MVACNSGRQFNILIYMHVSESYCDDILCYSFAKYLLIYEAFCACINSGNLIICYTSAILILMRKYSEFSHIAQS